MSGTYPTTGRAGLEPPYRWKSKEPPSPSYKFEDKEWGTKRLEEEEGEESPINLFLDLSLYNVNN
jgi:hypothetical protein